MGRLYKRGNTWWIDYGFRGKRYRESSGSHRKSDAKKLLRRRLEEMGRGRLVGPDAESMTLDELERLLLDDYRLNGKKSTKRVELAMRTLKARIPGYARALDLTTSRVNRYIAERLEGDRVRPATVQKELAALKRAFNLAVRAGLLDYVPHIPNLQVRNARAGFFEREDFDGVLRELPEYLKAPMLFGYLTGWRVRSEVLRLTWAQVDFGTGTVRLEPETTKNREGRVFPFATLPELGRLLGRQWESTTALEKATGQIIPWVFHHRGHSIRHYKAAWHSACVRAGVGRWNDPENRRGYVGPIVHDLRRTAARNLVRAGVPEIVAMRLCGHKTRAIFDRYSIVNETMLKEGVEKLAQLHRTELKSERGIRPLRHSNGTVSGSEPKSAVGSGS